MGTPPTTNLKGSKMKSGTRSTVSSTANWSQLATLYGPKDALSISSIKRTKTEKIAFHQIRQSVLFASPQLNRPTLI